MKVYHIIKATFTEDKQYIELRSGSKKGYAKFKASSKRRVAEQAEKELLRRGMIIHGYGHSDFSEIVFMVDNKWIYPKFVIKWTLLWSIDDNYYWTGNNGSIYNVIKGKGLPVGGYTDPELCCALVGVPRNSFEILRKFRNESERAEQLGTTWKKTHRGRILPSNT